MAAGFEALGHVTRKNLAKKSVQDKIRTLILNSRMLTPLLISSLFLLCTHALDSSALLAEELKKIPEHHCMSTWMLEDAVKAAAYTSPNSQVGEACSDRMSLTIKLSMNPQGVEQRGIILTSCDLNCLKTLFEAFMWGVVNNRDGDFSKHVVIV